MPEPLPTLRVRTAHSDYIIDQENRTFVRTPRHPHANNLSSYNIGPDDKVSYDEGYIHLDEGMILTHVNGGIGGLLSTRVKSIEEIF